MAKLHTQKSTRDKCAPLASYEGPGIHVGRVWIERIGPYDGVSLGNVYVRVFSEGQFITMGRFNHAMGAILHEANRG